MLPSPETRRPNKLKRGRVDESPATRQEHHQTAKRQKREQTPPAFWNNLSRVPLCRRALREFERRSKDTVPPKPPNRTDLQQDQKRKLKRFARHGGPDCQDIIAYPDKRESRKHADDMSSRGSRSSGSRRSSGSSSSSSRPRSSKETIPTTLSSKDPAFEQTIIDHQILTGRGAKPTNWKKINDRLMVPRASLSPSRFTEEHFEQFQMCNDAAHSEADVMRKVMPRITKDVYPSVTDRLFTNLYSMTNDETKPPKPDIYEGSQPVELHRTVRQDLSEYIVPSSHHGEPLLPNHFTEVKGRDGNARQMQLQATYDAAYGTRAMHQIFSYGRDEQQYDGNAHSFASTYHSGTGTLQLFAAHATAPTEVGGKPSYNINQLDSFGMTGNYKTHVAGLTAYRNLQGLAEEERAEGITHGNGVIRGRNLETIIESPATSFGTAGDGTLMSFMASSSSQVDSDDTSTDELARDFSPPAKRTSRSSNLTSSSKRSRTTTTTTERHVEQWTWARGVFNCFVNGKVDRTDDECPLDAWVYCESGWPEGEHKQWRMVYDTGAVEYR